jgi:hypothetical protein
MLSRDEEGRLAAFLGVLKRDLKDGLTEDPDIKLESYLWLAEKLKEVNDEVKLLKEGCSHRGDTYQEREDAWIIKHCSICNAILETYIE